MKKRFACLAFVIVPLVLAQEIVLPPRPVQPPPPPVLPPPLPPSPDVPPRFAPEAPPVSKPKENYFVITVEEGETLQDIARSYIIPVAELAKVNGLKPGERIKAGDKLKIPPSVY